MCLAIYFSPLLSPQTANESDVHIPECPAFFPTEAQWEDPLAYIASIAHVSATAGIARIVPPGGWAPPPVPIPPAKFPTKLQKVHCLQVPLSCVCMHVSSVNSAVARCKATTVPYFPTLCSVFAPCVTLHVRF